MEDILTKMYTSAQRVLRPRRISPFVEAGAVASAILTVKGNIYLGVCIDTACTLGTCAERNAITHMITNGEHKIAKLLCIEYGGNFVTPCGACREYLMQLDSNHKNIQILLDFQQREFTLLEDLLPNWWGTKRWKP